MKRGVFLGLLFILFIFTFAFVGATSEGDSCRCGCRSDWGWSTYGDNMKFCSAYSGNYPGIYTNGWYSGNMGNIPSNEESTWLGSAWSFCSYPLTISVTPEGMSSGFWGCCSGKAFDYRTSSCYKKDNSYTGKATGILCSNPQIPCDYNNDGIYDFCVNSEAECVAPSQGCAGATGTQGNSGQSGSQEWQLDKNPANALPASKTYQGIIVGYFYYGGPIKEGGRNVMQTSDKNTYVVTDPSNPDGSPLSLASNVNNPLPIGTKVSSVGENLIPASQAQASTQTQQTPSKEGVVCDTSFPFIQDASLSIDKDYITKQSNGFIDVDKYDEKITQDGKDYTLATTKDRLTCSIAIDIPKDAKSKELLSVSFLSSSDGTNFLEAQNTKLSFLPSSACLYNDQTSQLNCKVSLDLGSQYSNKLVKCAASVHFNEENADSEKTESNLVAVTKYAIYFTLVMPSYIKTELKADSPEADTLRDNGKILNTGLDAWTQRYDPKIKQQYIFEYKLLDGTVIGRQYNPCGLGVCIFTQFALVDGNGRNSQYYNFLGEGNFKSGLDKIASAANSKSAGSDSQSSNIDQSETNRIYEYIRDPQSSKINWQADSSNNAIDSVLVKKIITNKLIADLSIPDVSFGCCEIKKWKWVGLLPEKTDTAQEYTVLSKCETSHGGKIIPNEECKSSDYFNYNEDVATILKYYASGLTNVKNDLKSKDQNNLQGLLVSDSVFLLLTLPLEEAIALPGNNIKEAGESPVYISAKTGDALILTSSNEGYHVLPRIKWIIGNDDAGNFVAANVKEGYYPSSASASSEKSSIGKELFGGAQTYYASALSDNNLATTWIPSETDINPQVYLDLGESKIINGIKVTSLSSNLPLAFDVDVSDDGATWNNAISSFSIVKTDKAIQVTTIPINVNGRYLRLSNIKGDNIGITDIKIDSSSISDISSTGAVIGGATSVSDKYVSVIIVVILILFLLLIILLGSRRRKAIEKRVRKSRRKK